MQPNTIKWMLAADSDYEKILNKNPEKAIENYDDLKPFENRCLSILVIFSSLSDLLSVPYFNFRLSITLCAFPIDRY
jgi:hypothetical protein